MTTLSPKTWPDWAKTIVRLALFGAACGVAGYGFGWLLATQIFPDAPPPSELNLRWSDILAFLVAAGMILGAAAMLIVSLNPRRLGRMYRLEGDASSTEAAQARLQSIVMGLSGVVLALPLIFSLTGVPPILGVVAIVLLLVLHTVLNLRVYRQADEMLRRLVLEAATLTFFLGQGLLFLWAVAERLGVAPPITTWDIYAVLMTFYLVVAVTVSARRGLA